MQDQDIFINYINNHYDELKWKYYNFCREKQFSWDEDIYSETILRCYDTIQKKGKLNDTTPHGIESYFFLAFKNNIMNEKNYCRTRCRDYNYTTEKIAIAYDDWYNKTNDTAREKLISDLFKDFAVLYIMYQVEANFDAEYFYLYRLKSLIPNMTFKKLADTTHIKASRRKVIEVQRWVKDNIKKEEIRKSFNRQYGDII